MHQDDSGRLVAKVELPLHCATSVDLIAAWYAYVHADAAADVALDRPLEPAQSQEVSICLIDFCWDYTDELGLHATLGDLRVVFKLRKIRQMQMRQRQRKTKRRSGADGDVAEDEEEEVDGAVPGVGDLEVLDDGEIADVVGAAAADEAPLAAVVDNLCVAYLERVHGLAGHDEDHFDEWHQADVDRDMPAEQNEQDLRHRAQLKRKAGTSSASASSATCFADADVFPEEARDEQALASALCLPGDSGDTGDPRDTADKSAGASENPAWVAASTSADLEAVFAKWVVEADEGAATLRERADALATIGLGGEWPWDMSLMSDDVAADGADSQTRSELFYVHWQNPSKRLGWRVRLEGQQVVWPAAQRPRSFATAAIVHPAIGVRAARLRGPQGGLRTLIPERIARLKRMWETISGDDDVFPVCAGCGSVVSATVDVIRVCGLCQLAWHKGCVGRVAADLNTRILRKECVLNGMRLTGLLVDEVVCDLCYAWVPARSCATCATLVPARSCVAVVTV